ncbi:MAG: LCP family protein [Candidatus Eremiobacteraeota bacterium]|nr:LCP family protein [Candidatus Eremiobacteraeota bacterium]MBC5827773.1 LCP family protein [Candidatus Eremiobacteraeota bacterium]
MPRSFDDARPADDREDTIVLPSPPARKRSGAPLLLIALALVLAAAAGAALLGTNGGWRNVLADIPLVVGRNLPQAFGKDKLLVLVMGIDDNWNDLDESYTAGARTDTLLAVSIDLNTKDIGILSIPRDLWVDIPKSGFGKINSAFSGGGPQRSELTVEKTLGTPPFDYYFVLKIDATRKIVDAIGGLAVNVEKDMDYDDSWGHLHIHLKKGLQHLNGEQTVGYIRFRHDEEGDLGRMRRQRQITQTLVRRFQGPAIALRVPALIEVVRANARSDMPVDKMVDLAAGLREVTPQKVHSAQVPADVGWTDGQSVLYEDRTQTGELVRKYLVVGFGSRFDPSTVHVKVENGSGTPGAASALADYLRQRGFTIVGTGNAGTFNNAQTTVIGVNATLLGEVTKRLPMHNVRFSVGRVKGGDIDIVVGQDYRIQ